MANGTQCRYIDVPDTYVISKFSKIIDMCVINKILYFCFLQSMYYVVTFGEIAMNSMRTSTNVMWTTGFGESLVLVI